MTLPHSETKTAENTMPAYGVRLLTGRQRWYILCRREAVITGIEPAQPLRPMYGRWIKRKWSTGAPVPIAEENDDLRLYGRKGFFAALSGIFQPSGLQRTEN